MGLTNRRDARSAWSWASCPPSSGSSRSLRPASTVVLGLSAAAGVALGANLVVSAGAGQPAPAGVIGGVPRAKVLAGVALAVLAPVVAVALWWSALRLPPNKRAEVDFYVQSAHRARRERASPLNAEADRNRREAQSHVTE